MFSFNDKDIRQMESDLKTFADRAYPFATKNTLNSAAFQTQKAVKKRLKFQLVLRNRFTVQSIRVEQARTLVVSRQEATIGSTAPYMEKQEFGGQTTKAGKHGVPIATGYAAGQEGVGQRTRLPTAGNKLQDIKLGRQRARRRARNKRQSLVGKVHTAIRTGRREVFHDFGSGRKKGIFRVVGGDRSVKRGWPGNARLKMLYDLSEQTVHTPKRPWLSPAVKKIEKKLPAIHKKSLEFQLKRHRLFRNI